MPSIGGVSLDLLKGRVPTLRDTVEVWRRDGFDSYGARTNGKADGEFALMSVKYVTGATKQDAWDAAEVHLDDCRELQGTTVTVLDEFNISFEDCLVVKMDEAKVQKKACIKDGLNGVRVEIPWQMLRV